MRRALCLLASAAALLTPAAAVAQKPTSQTTEYSPYEKETIAAALKKLGHEIDPAPEGKVVEKIETVRLPVLEARDPGPELLAKVPIVGPAVREGILTRDTLNALHYETRDFIVRREMLVREGEPYVQVLVDETARNMRSSMPLQISLVVIVPVKSKDPEKVGIVVITKDIWSLRLSWDVAVTPGGVENFVLVPQETNLLGLHHTAQTRFQYQPETYTLGVGYSIPRFGWSWIGASATANVIVNRRRVEPEGSSAGISVGQGLYSTRTDWSWSADAGWTVGVARRYVNARVAAFDSRATPERDRIPFEYKSRSFSASVGVVRSFGWAFKNNFGLTLNAVTTGYETFDLSAFNPVAVADFRRRALPTAEDRVYPALSWSTFQTNFLRTLDINTLALQEDFRLGHEVSVSVYPVLRALGSTRNVFGVSGRAGYALALGDGLAGASVSTFAEQNEDGVITDGSVGASFGAVTPRFGIGRLVMNASFSNRYRNYLNARTFTGGDDRLRGYPSNFFFGKDTVFYNLEFRSRSVELLKLQFGGVVFFDAGDAATAFHLLRAKQSVGLGARILIPQLNRLVFRLDLAFPMQRGPFPETGIATPVDPVGFFFAFGQAFRP